MVNKRKHLNYAFFYALLSVFYPMLLTQAYLYKVEGHLQQVIKNENTNKAATINVNETTL